MRGSIVKRGRNSWAVVVYLGRDPSTGKRRYKWYSHETRREADAHLTQLLTHLQAGGAVPTTRLRVGDYLEQWLRDYAAGAVAPTTLRSYQETVRLHLAPALGYLPLLRLSAQAIQGYLSQKLKDGLSSTTVRYHATLLHQTLRHAVRWGLLPRNPCDLVEPPRRRRLEMRVLDEEQIRLFLGEAKKSSTFYPLYLAAVTSGMRIGELLGLRWRDLDFDLGVASVQQTFYRLGGKKKTGEATQLLFKAPKTEKARRTVALPAMLLKKLREVRDEQREQRQLMEADYQDLDLIFCQVNGKPLHARNIIQRDFRRVLGLKGLRGDLQRKGVPEQALPKPLQRIRFHDLRHSHATLLLAQGVHPKIVQERLGHASPAFTLQVYSHVLPGMQEEAARVLGERLQIFSKEL